MSELTIKTTVVFDRPFRIAGFDEYLPAGEYDIETEVQAPADHLDPEQWKASALVQLHPRASHPGLTRSLTVPLTVLEAAQVQDRRTGQSIANVFLDEMLSDPMIRLLMKADRVSEGELRNLYSRHPHTSVLAAEQDSGRLTDTKSENAAADAAENEGMPVKREKPVPSC